jgi:hypothetical protein
MSIKLNSVGGGSVTIQEPNTASDFTLSVPAKSGEVQVQNNMPAFSAVRTSNQTSISANTWTKVQLNVEDFDTASCFDSSTNYRFTPNVAGYYQVNGSVSSEGTSSYMGVAIYKNGSLFHRTWTENTQAMSAQVSCLIYFNGSTDYIELYGYISSSGTFYSATDRGCQMNGVLVRGA